MRMLPVKIVVATRNAGKVRELEQLTKGIHIEFVSLSEFEGIPDVVEDGLTFEENALKKARETFRHTGIPSMADDSGLCVDALEGRPGVLSARYAGPDVPDDVRYLKILDELSGIPMDRRGAKFVCVLALVAADGDEITFTGECSGTITTEPRGSSGFGYDPIFFYPPAGLTFGQMEKAAKNLVSHRADAMKKLLEELKRLNSENVKSKASKMS